MMAIPYRIPEQFLGEFAQGSIELYGAILKNTSTGQIVGHVQQTGMLDRLFQNSAGISQALSSAANPLGAVISGASALDSSLQMRSMNEKLTAMQGSLSFIQGVGLATLATSVIGIGVSVASTAIILKRLQGVSTQLDSIGTRLDGLPDAIEENRIRERLTTLKTQVERFGTRNLRNESGQVVSRVEETLHETFNQFAASLNNLSQRPNGDSELFKVLLIGLNLSGKTLVQALLAMNEMPSAVERAKSQSKTFEALAWDWPHDKMVSWTGLAGPDADGTLSLFEASLAQNTTQQLVVQNISDQGYQGSEYLAFAEEEESEPLLILPHKN